MSHPGASTADLLARLAESEARFDSLISSLPVLVWVADRDGARIELNTHWLQFTGRSLDTERGAGWLAGVHPDDRSMLRQTLREAGQSQQPFRVEYRLRDAHGEYRRVHEHGVPRGLPGAGFAGHVGSAVDVTDHWLTLDDLRSTRAQLELVLGHLPVITYTGQADGSFRTTYMSDNVLSVTGMTPQTFIGQPGFWIERIHPDDRTEPFVSIEQLGHGRAVEVEYRWKRSDGSWIWFLDVMRLVGGDDSDGPQLIVGALLDISARKASELVLHETREQARELSARLFRIREDEQRRISRELHDQLGQMLTALSLDVEWLARKLGQDELLRPRVERMAHTLDATLDEVRRLARDLRPTVLDDLGLAAAVGMHVERVRDLTGLEVHTQIELGDQPPDDELSTALFRMLQEALTNVARHAHAQRVDVQLRREGDSVKLVVHDDGRGISEAEAHGRTSMGLAGLRERARQLDGQADVRPHPDGGTEVVALLPLRPG